MSKKIKLSLKEIYESAKKVASGQVIVQEDMILGEIDGIPVIRSSEMVHSITSLLACTTALNTIYGTTVRVICVDEYFDLAPKYVQEFVINHEIGHIKNKHFENGSVNASFKHIFTRSIKLSKEEVEADLYAYNKIGKENSILALEYILNTFKVSKKDTKSRLKVIKSY